MIVEFRAQFYYKITHTEPNMSFPHSPTYIPCLESSAGLFPTEVWQLCIMVILCDVSFIAIST